MALKVGLGGSVDAAQVSVRRYGQCLRALACGGVCTLRARGGTWRSGSPGAATFPWAINNQFRTGTEAGNPTV